MLGGAFLIQEIVELLLGGTLLIQHGLQFLFGLLLTRRQLVDPGQAGIQKRLVGNAQFQNDLRRRKIFGQHVEFEAAARGTDQPHTAGKLHDLHPRRTAELNRRMLPFDASFAGGIEESEGMQKNDPGRRPHADAEDPTLRKFFGKHERERFPLPRQGTIDGATPFRSEQFTGIGAVGDDRNLKFQLLLRRSQLLLGLSQHALLIRNQLRQLLPAESEFGDAVEGIGQLPISRDGQMVVRFFSFPRSFRGQTVI